MDFTPEDILKQQRRNWQQSRGPLLALAVLFAAMGVVLTSFYSVGPDEISVVTRLGKFVRLAQPGLHVKWPLGIELQYPVKVKRVYEEEFGFRGGRSGSRQGASRYEQESLMLTGDLNVLEVNWIVQFQISDPVKYLFRVHEPEEALRDVSEAVMRRVVGDHSVDEVLSTQREAISDIAAQELQDIMDRYDAGIQVVTVKLRDVTPPDAVKPAFNEVNEAKQERERMINQAMEAYNREIPRAKGQADQMILQADGYALDAVNRAKGEADRFNSVYAAYKLAPEVTRTRLYLETLSDVLPRAKKFLMDGDQASVLPLLQLQQPQGAEQ